MQIHATFIRRTYEPTSVELIHAWDEYCVDDNPSGYHETLKDELDSIGTDLLDARTLLIEVDHDAVLAAFADQKVTGTIIDTGGDA